MIISYCCETKATNCLGSLRHEHYNCHWLLLCCIHEESSKNPITLINKEKKIKLTFEAPAIYHCVPLILGTLQGHFHLSSSSRNCVIVPWCYPQGSLFSFSSLWQTHLRSCIHTHQIAIKREADAKRCISLFNVIDCLRRADFGRSIAIRAELLFHSADKRWRHQL